MLMNTLHNIPAKATVRGTVKESWNSLAINYDNRIEFQEFEKYHRQFPQLFEPAFQLQIKLMNKFMGETWWKFKKRQLQNIKDKIQAKEQRKADKIERRRQNVRSNKIMARMGCGFYYLAPCLRGFYAAKLEQESPPPPVDPKEQRQLEIAAAQRQADADAKNQETAEWQRYEKKINPDKGGSEQYIEKKIVKVARNRASRVESRKDRKKQRNKLVDDGFDRPQRVDEDAPYL